VARKQRGTSIARQHGLIRPDEELVDSALGDIRGLYVNAVDRPYGRSTALLGLTSRRLVLGGKDIDLAVELIMVRGVEYSTQHRAALVSWVEDGSIVALLWSAVSQDESLRIVDSLERERSRIRTASPPDAVAAIDEAGRLIQRSLIARQSPGGS
jgi:hypothetical protein